MKNYLIAILLLIIFLFLYYNTGFESFKNQCRNISSEECNTCKTCCNDFIGCHGLKSPNCQQNCDRCVNETCKRYSCSQENKCIIEENHTKGKFTGLLDCQKKCTPPPTPPPPTRPPPTRPPPTPIPTFKPIICSPQPSHQTPTPAKDIDIVTHLFNKFMLNYKKINKETDAHNYKNFPNLCDIQSNKGPLTLTLFDEKTKSDTPYKLNLEKSKTYSGSILSLYMLFSQPFGSIYDMLCTPCIDQKDYIGMVFNTDKNYLDILCSYLSDGGTDFDLPYGCNCPYKKNETGYQKSQYADINKTCEEIGRTRFTKELTDIDPKYIFKPRFSGNFLNSGEPYSFQENVLGLDRIQLLMGENTPFRFWDSKESKYNEVIIKPRIYLSEAEEVTDSLKQIALDAIECFFYIEPTPAPSPIPTPTPTPEETKQKAINITNSFNKEYGTNKPLVLIKNTKTSDIYEVSNQSVKFKKFKATDLFKLVDTNQS